VNEEALAHSGLLRHKQTNKRGNINYFRACNLIELIEKCHFRLRGFEVHFSIL
jgi:hypothetical protein